MESPLDARVRLFNEWVKERQGDALGPLEGYEAGWRDALTYVALALDDGENEDYDTGAEGDSYHYTYYRAPGGAYASDAADVARIIAKASFPV